MKKLTCKTCIHRHESKGKVGKKVYTDHICTALPPAAVYNSVNQRIEFSNRVITVNRPACVYHDNGKD